MGENANSALEDQNQFYYDRPGADLVVSGKPDLLAILGDVVEVCDCKTGQPRASDDVQVMLYMYFLPRSSQKFRGKTFRGQLVYADDRVEIPKETS